MIEVIKLLFLVAYIYFIGYCIFNSIVGNSKNKNFSIFYFLGLCGAIGIGATSFELLFFSFLKIPWRPLFLAFPWILTFIYFIVAKRIKPQVALPDKISKIILIYMIILTLMLMVWVLFNPVHICDGWAIWNFKAQVFFLRKHIPLDFLLDPKVSASHMDYVLLLPLAQSWIYFHLGYIHTGYSQVIYIILYLSMLFVVFDFLQSTTKNKFLPIVITTLLALTPWLIELSQINYADMVISAYVVCSLAMIIRYFEEKEDVYFYFLSILLGFTAFTKSEGILIYFFFGLYMLFHNIVLDRKKIKYLLFKNFLPILISLSAWFIWTRFTSRHGILSDNPPLNVNFAYTMANFYRIKIILTAFLQEYVRHYSHWGLIWSLFIASFLAALINKLGSTKYYLIIFFIIITYFSIYYYTVQELHWMLSGSMDRLAAQIAPSAILLFGFTLTLLWNKTLKSSQ